MAKIEEDDVSPRENGGNFSGGKDVGNNDLFPSFQDRLEDIRDAIVETETYAVVSKQVAAVRRVSVTAWNVSRRVVWIVATSMLVLVLPVLYEVDKELGTTFDPNSPNQPAPSSSPTPPSTAAPSSGADSAKTS